MILNARAMAYGNAEFAVEGFSLQNGRAYLELELELGVRYSLWSEPRRFDVGLGEDVLKLPIDEQQAPTAGSGARAR